jgi:hypothetical protein
MRFSVVIIKSTGGVGGGPSSLPLQALKNRIEIRDRIANTFFIILIFK